MRPVQELKIEYKRLSRHVNFLEKRFNVAVARDLAASLRNWVQLSDTIGQIALDESWIFKFSKETLPKKLKNLRSNGNSIAVPLPASVRSNNMQISGVVKYDRALSSEEIMSSYKAGLSAKPSAQQMSFDTWLNNSAYQVRVQGENKDISRKIFIDRSANLLGGTHPMTNFVESDHATWADPYIVDSLSTQIGLWPVPYSILMESAQEIIRVFKPYLDQ